MRLCSVSYTHLDVYKRQVGVLLTGVAFLTREAIGYGDGAVTAIAGMMLGLSMIVEILLTALGAAAVVDVYKRQFHSSFGQRENYVEQLVWGELGDYVRRLIREAVSYTHLDVYKRQGI